MTAYLSADAIAYELENGACVIVKTANDGGVHSKHNAHIIKTLLQFLKVGAAVVT